MFSYKVGEAFLHIPQSRALKRLERDQTSIDGKVAALALQADECEVQMKGLKVVLYAKFGKAINLDE
jgi:prefoldin subunit 4